MIPSTVPTTARSVPALGAAGADSVDASRLAPCRPPVPMQTMSGSTSAIAVPPPQRSTCHVATYARHPRLVTQAFGGLPMASGLVLGAN